MRHQDRFGVAMQSHTCVSCRRLLWTLWELCCFVDLQSIRNVMHTIPAKSSSHRIASQKPCRGKNITNVGMSEWYFAWRMFIFVGSVVAFCYCCVDKRHQMSEWVRKRHRAARLRWWYFMCGVSCAYSCHNFISFVVPMFICFVHFQPLGCRW